MTSIADKTINTIDKLRSRPEHVRHMISIIIAGAFTLVLFVVWTFVLLPFRISENTKVVKDKEISPFASLSAQVGILYSGFMGDLKRELGTSDESGGSLWQNGYEKLKSEAQGDSNQ